MATHAHNYRPRYSYEETNPLNPANHPIRSCSSVIWDCLCGAVAAVGPILCANRRRGAVSVGVVALLAFVLINFIAPRVYETSGHIGSHKVARQESLGLYSDIAGRRWADLRDKAREARRQSSPPADPSSFAVAIDFYEQYKPEFSCPNEKLVGDDAGRNSAGGSAWFICNPQGMPGAYKARPVTKRQKGGLLGVRNAKQGCLIYTSKRTSTLGFETALMSSFQGSDTCDIHVFAPGEISDTSRNNANTQSSVYLDNWGLKGSSVPTNPGSGRFKTFQETVKELGHTDRDIDLLVLDCVGCEWDVMKDLFPPSGYGLSSSSTAEAQGVGDIMQIVLNLYEKPDNANELFQAMKLNNYAIFHKEEPAPTEENQFGFSFIKLAPGFWDEGAENHE